MQAESAMTASVRRLLQDKAGLQAVTSARDGGWRTALWSGIEEVGMNIAAAPEACGGVGLGMQEAFDLLRVAGNMALEAPVAETMLANWMLGAGGLPARAGQIAFGPSSFADAVTLEGGTVHAGLKKVAFAADCREAVLLAQQDGLLSVVAVSLQDATYGLAQTLAWEPVGQFLPQQFAVIQTAPAPHGFTAATTMLMGAAARSMQIAGALEAMLAMTIDYVTQRRAFERSISKFQAVQQSVARLAGEVAVSLSAAASAAQAIDGMAASPDDGLGFADPELLLEIMAAKIRSAAAAQSACAIAHQLFGAIGVTREHPLHRLTLRAQAWADDFGNEAEWGRRLGELVCSRGAQALWPLLATR